MHRLLSWQGDHLPTFGAEADIPLDELPHDDFLARQKSRLASQLLADQRRGAAVVDDGSKAEAELVRQV